LELFRDSGFRNPRLLIFFEKETENKLLIMLLLFCPIIANAQARPSMCRIFPLWIGGSIEGAEIKAILDQFENPVA
jgi:hypothetical protein